MPAGVTSHVGRFQQIEPDDLCPSWRSGVGVDCLHCYLLAARSIEPPNASAQKCTCASMTKITSGTWIENPVAGQRALLVKLPARNGWALFRNGIYLSAFHSQVFDLPHYHPAVTERFEITRGKARFMLGKVKTARQVRRFSFRWASNTSTPSERQ